MSSAKSRTGFRSWPLAELIGGYSHSAFERERTNPDQRDGLIRKSGCPSKARSGEDRVEPSAVPPSSAAHAVNEMTWRPSSTRLKAWADLNLLSRAK